MPRDAARMVVRMQDGRTEEVVVDHIEALDDDSLAEKARGLLEPILGAAAGTAVARLTALKDSDAVTSVVEAVTPVS